MSKQGEPTREVGRRVQALRKQRGWSAEVLAQRLGSELDTEVPGYIARRLERGERPITADEVAALASIFGVSESDLFGSPAGDSTVFPVLARAATARSGYLDAAEALWKAERELAALDLDGASERAAREHDDILGEVRRLLDDTTARDEVELQAWMSKLPRSNDGPAA